MPKNELFVKPSRSGAVVRFPDDAARTLAPEGEAVPRSAYWTRRLADQSVVETTPAATSTPITKSTKEAK